MMPHMLTMTALQIRNPVPLFILMKSDDRLVHVTRSLWYISRTILRDMVLRRGAHEGLRGPGCLDWTGGILTIRPSFW